MKTIFAPMISIPNTFLFVLADVGFWLDFISDGIRAVMGIFVVYLEGSLAAEHEPEQQG